MAIRSVRVNEPSAIASGTRAAGIGTPPPTGAMDVGFRVNIGTDLRQAVDDLRRQVEAMPDDADTDAISDVVLVYRTQEDDRVRPEHMALHGTVWEVDDPERPVPPIAPGCRCYLEVMARNKAAAARNGLPVVDSNPPKNDAQAIRQYLEDSGLDAAETKLGPVAGSLLDNGDIRAEQLFDDAGNFIGATKAQAIASAGGNAKAFRLVVGAYANLQGLGITAATVKRVASLARAAQAGDASLDDIQAIRRALDGLLAGGAIGYLTRGDTRAVNAAAEFILRALGGAL